MENMVWNLIKTKNMMHTNLGWADIASTCRAFVFGEMVELANGRVNQYRSDLYHDALWLNEFLKEEMQFDWVVREWGTFIGTSAANYGISDKDLKYRFEIINDNGRWSVNIYQSVPLVSTVNVPDTTNNFLDSDGTFTEDDQGNWRKIVYGFPTLRNETTEKPKASLRKETGMFDIIRDLREKFETAEAAKQELEDYLRDINDGIAALEEYLSELDDLISNLDSLPEVSVRVDLESVEFES
jgi:hypothetical protein